MKIKCQVVERKVYLSSIATCVSGVSCNLLIYPLCQQMNSFPSVRKLLHNQYLSQASYGGLMDSVDWRDSSYVLTMEFWASHLLGSLISIPCSLPHLRPPVENLCHLHYLGEILNTWSPFPYNYHTLGVSFLIDYPVAVLEHELHDFSVNPSKKQLGRCIYCTYTAK